ncbi:hypothetical protein GCM10023169_18100 [Georgenia halophila]|uniref:Uncharacterized protein n=1 Tax=Georgenia halophila TaxID=620889 RepID=A0ABP8L6B8_9MICO
MTESTGSNSASELADEAKQLAEDAAEHVDHTRPDDEDMAGADVEATEHAPDHEERLNIDNADEDGEELTDPGAPMP